MKRIIATPEAGRVQQGFTLIELMVVVVIVAILAAVAYPSYTQYVIRGHRAAAQTEMMDIANRQQQIFLANRGYATTLAELSYTLPAQVSARYPETIATIEADNTATPPTFTITFTPSPGGGADRRWHAGPEQRGDENPGRRRCKMVNARTLFPHTQGGTSMIEVLVTIVILTIGLLGLAGLQARLQVSEMEAYQRAQALILLNDMASRVATNRAKAADYAIDSPLVGSACPTNTSTRQKADAAEWCAALGGAGETLDGGRVGAMVGGRGCVEELGSGKYLVTVAWQGLTPIFSPAAGCGQGSYNGGTACVNDLCRRTVTTIVRIANLVP